MLGDSVTVLWSPSSTTTLVRSGAGSARLVWGEPRNTKVAERQSVMSGCGKAILNVGG